MSFIGPELPPNLKNIDEPSEIGPQIPVHRQSALDIYDEDDDNDGPRPATGIGPSIPAQFSKVPQSSVYDGDDDGPELPPHLREERREEEADPSAGKRQIGPTLPSYAPTYDPATHYDEDDDDDDDFGPKPLPAGMQHQQTDAVKEFIEREEKRRKLAEVCTKHQIYFTAFFVNVIFSAFLNRMLSNLRAFNGTNGCLSHLLRQVFLEVSKNKYLFIPNLS